MALEQVPQPDPRRRGAADPEPERLQDRQPVGPLAHQSRGAAVAVRRIRLHAVLRRGERSRGDAPEDGRYARGGDRGDSRESEARPRVERAVPAALADDRPPLAQRVDRAGDDQGPQSGGVVAGAPGAVLGGASESGQPAAARELAAQLRARAALRCRRQAPARAEGARAAGRPPHERQSARQRRTAAQGPETARFPEVRRRRAGQRRGPGPRTRGRSASSCATSSSRT